MSQKDNIEELFKTKLESFESPVNDAMWSNISSSLGSATTSSAAATSIFSKIFSTTGIAITTGLICTAVTFFVMSSPENVVTTIENESVVKEANISNQNNTEQANNEVVSDDEIAVNNIVSGKIEKTDDPSVKEEKVEKYIVRPNVTEEDEKGYTKEPSYVHSFLTPENQRNTSKDEVKSNKDSVSQPILNTISIVKAEEDDLIATIIASPVGGYAPLDVYFTNPATRGNVHWDFGDGTTSSESSPSHTFDEYGTYTIELTLIDENGKEQKDYRVIEVEANSAITDIPNVFTPNGDGINDFCTVKGKNLEFYQIKVFNRLGDVIFFSESINNSWDGKSKYGENIPTGTYFYLITAKGIDGKVYEHTGSITLSR